MGSKVVTIEPDYNEWGAYPFTYMLPKTPLQVIFTTSKPKLEKRKRNQTVTNCLIRYKTDVLGVGFAVENPNDERNEMEGIHWAYKRAVQSMLKNIQYHKKCSISIRAQKIVDKVFRQALWEAMK